MSDTYDLLTLAEAKTALNITTTAQDTELPGYITAISRRLDELCGPIVLRTYTDEEYDGNCRWIVLRHAPASETSATTVTTVKEYMDGTATTLAAETLTVSTTDDYRFDQRLGILYRRSTWSDTVFASQRVTVTYSGGRYSATATVDEKFKQAARSLLQHVWRPEQGTSTVTFPTEYPGLTVPGFFIPNMVLDQLAGEVQYYAIA